MNVFNTVKKMNKKEFADFLYKLYWKAYIDGGNSEDDSPWIECLVPDMSYEKYNSEIMEELSQYNKGGK